MIIEIQIEIRRFRLNENNYRRIINNLNLNRQIHIYIIIIIYQYYLLYIQYEYSKFK